MRRYLLDTGPLGAYLQGRPAIIELLTPWLERQEASTSILAYAEVVEYIKGFPQFRKLHTQLRRLLRQVYPYFLTYRILERYADIRRTLRQPHGPGLIGDIDTLIAATALEHNLTMVTIDTDFQRVPNLRVILLSRSTMEVLSTS
ncbi:MAG TPA: type II toxin-antitoxin system VapC family toxin [Dehalococcoidia bacterium]|nr:type II toxin-antitoxin system VapC family toxin [Dehalococcoidia bacterium]